MPGHRHRIVLVLRIAVAREQDGDRVVRRRELRQPRDDRRINAAAQADDEPGAAGCLEMLPHPAGETFRSRHGGILQLCRSHCSVLTSQFVFKFGSGFELPGSPFPSSVFEVRPNPNPNPNPEPRTPNPEPNLNTNRELRSKKCELPDAPATDKTVVDLDRVDMASVILEPSRRRQRGPGADDANGWGKSLISQTFTFTWPERSDTIDRSSGSPERNSSHAQQQARSSLC